MMVSRCNDRNGHLKYSMNNEDDIEIDAIMS